ncbi:MAG: S-methyl-5'-thioadenosine phosphorylase [Deltaproteobacteria bacterium]|nr:S-methyl-5'-thioadenosine phosphorylase [Deltaproteobacteria bacterium]
MSIIGVIGGSGLYEIEELTNVEEVSLETPFGPPSDNFIIGELSGVKMVFLPRHGGGHRITPSELNFRANIYGMKKLGVERIISVSAVGSMKEEIEPGHIVIPNQFIDLTKGRKSTFFSGGVVGHVTFADPICGELGKAVYDSALAVGAKTHFGGTYVCIEGPQFSTRAESRVYRSWDVDVIGMTNVTEAKLAREAEMCYTTIALSTDYDCWHEEEEDVSVEAILEIIKNNVNTARAIIRETAGRLSPERGCRCGSALEYAIISDRSRIPENVKKDLEIIIGKYI